MHFQIIDTASKVSRGTRTKLARHSGCKRELEVLRYAVRKLGNEVLPTYEPDDGLFTKKQLAAIRKVSPAGK